MIAGRRRELGQSQRDLTDEACVASGCPTVTRHEISRYERETRTPAAASLGALAAALHLPEAALRQAANFTRQRRRVGTGDPQLLRDLHPGYLIGGYDDVPRPMLTFGAI